jgi:peroxin-11B
MAVSNALVYHPTIAHYLRFVATTVGRDKVLRVLQYFSRFYAWYLLRTNALPSSIAPFTAIKSQFALARKVFRIGKNVEHFKAAAIAADTKGGDAFLKYCAIGRQLGYAFYLTLDMSTYMDSAGIWKTNFSKSLHRKSLQAWISGLVFSITMGLYSLRRLKGREGLASKQDGEGVIESKMIQK